MSKLNLHLFAVVMLLFSLACGSDDGPSNPAGGDPQGGDGPVTALIDGQSYVAEFATVQSAAGQTFINAAGSSPNWAIGFTFPGNGTGTYTFGPGMIVSAGVTLGSASWVGGDTNGSGTITVTASESNRIAGTFAFVVIGSNPASLNVTNGEFDIEF